LNGHLAKLGQFSDLRNARSTSDAIRIAWDISVPTNRTDEAPYVRRAVKLDTVSCDISFGIPPGGSSQVLQLNPKLFECFLSCSGIAVVGEDIAQSHSVRLRSKQDSVDAGEDVTDKPRRSWSFDFDIDFDQSSLDDLRDEISSPKPVGCNFQHFLPHWLIVQFDEQTEIIKALNAPLIDPLRSRAVRYLETESILIPNELLSLLNRHSKDLGRTELVSDAPDESLSLADTLRWLRGMRPKLRTKAPDIAKEVSALAAKVIPQKTGLATIDMPPLFRDALDYLLFFFSRNVRYLGPLREEPRAMYPLQDTADPQDIGLHGEHTAAVFHNYRHLELNVIPSAAFERDSIHAEPSRMTLEQAVFDWLNYLDVATRVKTRDEGKFGHALAVFVSDDVSHDLTHVGVGVSQILPIVVMCLLASRETTLILEQPELHLNPKVQTRLGDFFLSMALLGKQCLIETHSEYLINRLRYRAASEPTDSLSKLMTLYFVEKQAHGTAYRSVVINEFGTIVDWPSGFFDQSQREVEDILLAATKKAKSRILK
jgi:hypothetical protein